MPRKSQINHDKMTNARADSRDCRLKERNKLIAARFYYYTEIKRLRLDDSLKRLCDKEFFLGDRSIVTVLSEDTTISVLRSDPAEYRRFCLEHPEFNWK